MGLAKRFFISGQSTSEEFKEEVHCVEALGCFSTTIDFYDPIFRPINLPPDTRRDINTHYTLYTRQQTDGVPVRTHSINRIKLSSYNPQHRTKFIIHGFLDDQNSTWIKVYINNSPDSNLLLSFMFVSKNVSNPSIV